MNKNINLSVKFSEDGRITIPREIRRLLKLKGGEEFDIITKDDTLVLKIARKRCEICGEIKNVSTYNSSNGEVNLCDRCFKIVKYGNKDGE